MSPVEVNALAEVSEFQVGQLPVQYLGCFCYLGNCPLVIVNLLLNKITSKIQCKSSKYLSYAGMI